MNSSVGFTTFTMFHNHYLYRVPKLLATPEENPIPTKKSFPTPHPARPGNQQSAFCPYGFTYSGNFIKMELYNMGLLVSGFFFFYFVHVF